MRHTPTPRSFADWTDEEGLTVQTAGHSIFVQRPASAVALRELPSSQLAGLTQIPAEPSLEAAPFLAQLAAPAVQSPTLAQPVVDMVNAPDAMAVKAAVPMGLPVRASAPVTAFTRFWTSFDVPTDPLFARQWHLYNAGQTGGTAGVDLNVLPVWHLGFTGKGVSIGVFDTAMDVNHADLKVNIDLTKMITKVPDGSFMDPTVVTSVDSHATSVAGLIAGARNGVGTVGVAYDAKITPVNILGVQKGAYTWEALWQSYKFDVTNNSWGFNTPFVVSSTNASDRYWVLQGFDTAAVYGRGGLGTIQNLAAGNSRQSGMSTELTGVTVKRQMNVIGAVDYNGMVSYYSNAGASLLVVAPSSSVGAGSGITTDDVTGALGYTSGAYTTSFGGTSAATPEVAGVVAAMLQANRGLGWRDVQTILAITARHVGSAIGAAKSGYESDTWAWNAATNWNGGGMHFSNDYGFGLVDAFAAVELAKTWNVVMPAAQTSANELAASVTLNGTWNIGGARTNVLSFNITQHMNVEAMSLTFPTLSFAKANHLTVTLTDPTGKSSLLLANNGGNGAYISGGWELMSREFLNRDAYGTWKVTIVDNTASDVGTLKSAKLTAYGGSMAARSVFYYTDEYAQYWTAARSTLTYTGGYASIDAAATTGGMTLNLLTRSGTIDGKALTIAANTTVTKIVTGDGAARITANHLGNTIVSGLSNDVIVGGAGSDILDGGAGTNTLTTGAGADKVTLHRGALDYLTDFAPGMDKLVLSASEFAALAGGVTSAKFVSGAAATTRVAGGGLVFDKATSTLYADSGLAAAPLQALATFTNAANISRSDFLVA